MAHETRKILCVLIKVILFLHTGMFSDLLELVLLSIYIKTSHDFTWPKTYIHTPLNHRDQ